MTRFLYSALQAAAPAEAEPFDIKEMILHHLADSPKWEGPFGLELGWQFAPIHLGPITLDFSITKHVLFMMISAVLVAIIVIWAGRDAKRQHMSGAVRGPRGTTNVVEAFILFLRDEVALRNIGHGGERYVPYVVTVFFFILFCNLLGLLPWGASPTGNISVTATLALLTFIIVEVSGMGALGAGGYARTIFYVPPGLPAWMKPIMLVIFTPVEIIGKLTKPFALTIRLYANMTAGHAVVLAFTGMLVLAGIAGTIYIAPAPILMAIGILVLEIFVAFLQAYIFAMLSSVFIGLIRHAH
ncbi:MAG TPA: F0F1 ATP synthase subunit A [Longimicrobiales bacterium]|nr:F0F1 ATP synthase subunit A [Longimicrobiales bacterium]